MDRGGAHNHFPAAFGFIEPARLAARNHCNRRKIVGGHNMIGLLYGLTGDINREAHSVSILQTDLIMLIQSMMRVGETTLAFVCHNQLAEHQVVNLTILMGQITGDIVAPQLTFGELLNLIAEGIPENTQLLNLAPDNSSGAILGVAALSVERAGSRAGFPLSVGDGDGTSLGVAAGGNEPDEHRLVATERMIGHLEHLGKP